MYSIRVESGSCFVWDQFWHEWGRSFDVCAVLVVIQYLSRGKQSTIYISGFCGPKPTIGMAFCRPTPTHFPWDVDQIIAMTLRLLGSK